MTRTTPAILIAALAAMIGTGAIAAPKASVPESGKLQFDVIRKGRDIGDYTLKFRGKGDDLTVSVLTDVMVRVPVIGVSAYNFNQTGTETWKNGKLAALETTTDDNGTAHSIRVGATALVPASLWSADIVKSTQILNTIDGSTDRISVRNLGTETVETGHGAVEAQHFAISGDLQRELWFADAKLVHVRFQADDGSQIDYVLR